MRVNDEKPPSNLQRTRFYLVNNPNSGHVYLYQNTYWFLQSADPTNSFYTFKDLGQYKAFRVIRVTVRREVITDLRLKYNNYKSKEK